MRLFGIEPHPTVAHAELDTFVCTRCAHVQTKSHPFSDDRSGEQAMATLGLLKSTAFDDETTSLLCAAFDSAWQTVTSSGSALAHDTLAEASREQIAHYILESARQGERDTHRLVEYALARLAKMNSSSLLTRVAPAA
jgi:hypothetical protein